MAHDEGYYRGDQQPAGDVRRCGAHEGMVRETTLLGADVRRLFDEIRKNSEEIRETNEEFSKSLKSISESLANIDPAATKTRLTYNGILVSGGVSIVVALIANSDKLAEVWKVIRGAGY